MGDAAKGKDLFMKLCIMCHTTEKYGRHKTGPNLYDIMGKTAGTVRGFNYTKSIKEKAIVWDEKALDEYLESPNKFIPGTKMAFVGVKKPEDRKNLIAFLITLK